MLPALWGSRCRARWPKQPSVCPSADIWHSGIPLREQHRHNTLAEPVVMGPLKFRCLASASKPLKVNKQLRCNRQLKNWAELAARQPFMLVNGLRYVTCHSNTLPVASQSPHGSCYRRQATVWCLMVYFSMHFCNVYNTSVQIFCNTCAI